MQTAEKENGDLRYELSNLRSQLDKLKLDKATTEDYLIEAQHGLSQAQDELKQAQELRRRENENFDLERASHQHLVQEMTKEVRLQAFSK